MNNALTRKPVYTKKKTLKTDEKKFRWDLYQNQMKEEEASELPLGVEALNIDIEELGNMEEQKVSEA